MNKQTEALKMAIDDLELCNGAQTVEDIIIYTHEALKACKEALEDISKMETTSQPAQEPVAYIQASEINYIKAMKEEGIKEWRTCLGMNLEAGDVSLYTHPAPLQNEFAKTTSWQVLSDDEIQDAWYKLYPLDKNNLWDDMMIGKHLDKFARAIEQALKEKNHART